MPRLSRLRAPQECCARTAASLTALSAFLACLLAVPAVAEPRAAGAPIETGAIPSLQPAYMPYVQRSDGWWVPAPTRRTPTARLLERSIEPLPAGPNQRKTRSRPRLLERSQPEPGTTPAGRQHADASAAEPAPAPARPSVVLDRYGRWRYRDAAPAPERSARPRRTGPRWTDQRGVNANGRGARRERVADAPPLR
jgi:hypothetical protein